MQLLTRFRLENGFSWLFGASLLTGGLASGDAWAQTVTPSPSPTTALTTFIDPPAPYTWTRETGNVYFAALSDAGFAVNTALSFKNWDLAATSDLPTDDGLVYFDFRIEKSVTATAGKKLVLVVETDLREGSPRHAYIPLYSAGNTLCSAGASCLFPYLKPSQDPTALPAPTPNSIVYQAVDFGSAPRTLRVGFFLADICANIGDGTIRPYGCQDGSATSIDTPTNGVPAVFSLKFQIREVALAATEVLLGDTKKEELKVVLNVQSNGPTVSCSVSEIYFPGDGQILLNSDKVVGARQTGTAPIAKVVVLGERLPGSPDTGIPPSVSNDIVAYVLPTGSNVVSGFENTTDGSDNQYVLAFNVMDEAGVMPLQASSCRLGDGAGEIGVQTSAVQGFLGGNSCFVATAAFGSTEHEVVKELRRFRDQFLARSRLGRSMIELYYFWSPGAAAWVDANALMRLPALFFLIPFEFAAWLLLRPGLLLVLFLMTACGSGLLVLGRRV